jgi:hypothetical protein
MRLVDRRKRVFAVSLALSLPEDVITPVRRASVALTEATASTPPCRPESKMSGRETVEVKSWHGTAALRPDSETLIHAPCRRPGPWLQSAVSEARHSWIQLSLRGFFGRQEAGRKEREWPFATHFFPNPKRRQNKLTLRHPCVPLTKRPWVHGWRGTA